MPKSVCTGLLLDRSTRGQSMHLIRTHSSAQSVMILAKHKAWTLSCWQPARQKQHGQQAVITQHELCSHEGLASEESIVPMLFTPETNELMLALPRSGTQRGHAAATLSCCLTCLEIAAQHVCKHGLHVRIVYGNPKRTLLEWRITATPQTRSGAPPWFMASSATFAGSTGHAEASVCIDRSSRLMSKRVGCRRWVCA